MLWFELQDLMFFTKQFKNLDDSINIFYIHILDWLYIHIYNQSILYIKEYSRTKNNIL